MLIFIENSSTPRLLVHWFKLTELMNEPHGRFPLLTSRCLLENNNKLWSQLLRKKEKKKEKKRKLSKACCQVGGETAQTAVLRSVPQREHSTPETPPVWSTQEDVTLTHPHCLTFLLFFFNVMIMHFHVSELLLK